MVNNEHCVNKTVFKDSLTFRVLMAMIWRTPWGVEDLDYRREEILNTPKQPPQSFLTSPSESFYNSNACDHLGGEKSIPKGDRVGFRDMRWKARSKPVLLYFFYWFFPLGFIVVIISSRNQPILTFLVAQEWSRGRLVKSRARARQPPEIRSIAKSSSFVGTNCFKKSLALISVFPQLNTKLGSMPLTTSDITTLTLWGTTFAVFVAHSKIYLQSQCWGRGSLCWGWGHWRSSTVWSGDKINN